MESTDIEPVKTIIVARLSDLRRFAYSLTSNVSDADDLTQIVVEKLLTKPIPQDVSPVAWMFKVCKNAWIDELRSRKVRMVDSDYDLSSIIDSEKDPGDVQKERQINNLHQALGVLPEVYKVVISLIVISGLSYAQAAEVLDIPIGTVMSRVSRAREKLTELLKTTGYAQNE